MAWKSTDTAKLEMIHLDRILGFSDGRHEEVERARAKTCANCCRQAQELSDAGICLGCLT